MKRPNRLLALIGTCFIVTSKCTHLSNNPFHTSVPEHLHFVLQTLNLEFICCFIWPFPLLLLYLVLFLFHYLFILGVFIYLYLICFNYCYYFTLFIVTLFIYYYYFFFLLLFMRAHIAISKQERFDTTFPHFACNILTYKLLENQLWYALKVSDTW